MNWLSSPPALTQLYLQFLGALATAQTTFLPLMLSSLLHEFSDVTPSSTSKRTDLQLGAHWAIQHLLNVVPSGHTILLRLIKESFPHKSAERREQISYVYNLIRLGEYVEHLKGDILALCIERIVQVDVEIQYELDRLEDELEEELLLGHYDGTPYSPEDDINTEPSLEADEIASSALLDTSTTLAMMRETITTLDALMTTVFKYIDPLFPQSTDDVSSLHAEHLFDSLIGVFATSILPTYHSRHAQFFIFRSAQSHALFLDKFLGLLIERSLDPSLPNITRQASSAYLASFIARAKELSPDTIRTVVEMVCVFLGRVLDDCPAGKFVPGGVAGNQGLEGVYAVFQAVIYIYCFRWRELCDEHPETGEVIWIPQLNVIQRMAWSGLNPLAVLLPLPNPFYF
jgi:RNA polymerase I-specific transcription initiation factor RRN3